jgi:hypothetical protein
VRLEQSLLGLLVRLDAAVETLFGNQNLPCRSLADRTNPRTESCLGHFPAGETASAFLARIRKTDKPLEIRHGLAKL